MVMDSMGPSLENLFNFCGRQFTVKTACMLAIEMIGRVESLHKHGYLHRDLKPENFLIGAKKKQIDVFLIDFGLSKRFINPCTGNHIESRKLLTMTGTPRYCSLNAHRGWEQSRRDDLETIGIMLVYFLKGCLPWQGLKKDKPKDMDSIL